jgi:quinol monooxygenase YgiN
MDALAVWATMQARPGREVDARAFLAEATRRITDGEPGTTSFHAMDLGGGAFAIFNTFRDEAAFLAHVGGPVAAWVQASNADLFVAPYAINRAQIFAVKERAVEAA